MLRYEALLNERLARRPFLAPVPLSRGRPRARTAARRAAHAPARCWCAASPARTRSTSTPRWCWPTTIAPTSTGSCTSCARYQRDRASASRPARGPRSRLRANAARARDRFLTVLAEELADPLFALKREVHALGDALDETPAVDRLEAAQRHLRRLSDAVERAREVAQRRRSRGRLGQAAARLRGAAPTVHLDLPGHIRSLRHRAARRLGRHGHGLPRGRSPDGPARRAQGPPRAHGRADRALRAGGRAARRALAPRDRPLRRPRHDARRRALPGDGVARRPDARGRALRRPAHHRAERRSRPPRRRGARERAPPRHRPSRHQAREPVPARAAPSTAVRVLDFGLARRVLDQRRITQSGGIMGTPMYMAPEQARGEPYIDARADIFALGCVLFQCLTGQPPFTGPTAMAVLAKICLDEPVSVRELCPGLPPDLEQVLTRMLAKERGGRPPDATGVAVELQRIAERLARRRGQARARARQHRRCASSAARSRRASSGSSASCSSRGRSRSPRADRRGRCPARTLELPPRVRAPAARDRDGHPAHRVALRPERRRSAARGAAALRRAARAPPRRLDGRVAVGPRRAHRPGDGGRALRARAARRPARRGAVDRDRARRPLRPPPRRRRHRSRRRAPARRAPRRHPARRGHRRPAGRALRDRRPRRRARRTLVGERQRGDGRAPCSASRRPAWAASASSRCSRARSTSASTSPSRAPCS